MGHPINFRRVASCAACTYLGIKNAHYVCLNYDTIICSEEDPALSNYSYVCDAFKEEEVEEVDIENLCDKVLALIEDEKRNVLNATREDPRGDGQSP